jgi:hypothetical protein
MAITRQLHGALGIERDGSPVDTPRTQGQPSGGAAGASAGGSKTGTGHLERQREFQENQLEEIDTASLPAPRFTQEETNAMGPSEAEGGLPPLEGDVQRSESGGAVRGRIPGPGETIGGAFNKNDRSQLDEYLGPEAGGQLIDTITGRSDEEAPIEAEAPKPFGAATVESLSSTVKYMANWYKQIPGTGAKIARDSKEKGVETAYNVAKEINSWFGIESNFGEEEIDAAVDKNKDRVINKPATTPGEVPTQFRRDNAPANMQTREQVDTAIANANIPVTPDAITATADQVLRSQGKRPGFVELYNAVGLARLKIITPEQLMNYRQTGQFNAAAKRNLQVIQSGNVARIFDKDVGALSPAFRIDPTQGGAGSAGTTEQAAFLNLLQDDIPEDLFGDDKGRQATFISGVTGAMEILGYDLSSENGRPGSLGGLNAASQPRVRNAIKQGGLFIQRFDPDTAQNLFQGTGDFNPLPGSDPEFPVSAGSIALGTEAALHGITNQRDANEFLYQWGAQYLDAFSYLTAEELIVNVRQYEQYLRGQGLADINKARRELVEDLIEDATKKNRGQ